jgi:hypothetical protein
MHLWLHTLIVSRFEADGVSTSDIQASAYLTNTSQRGPVQTSSWSGDAPMDSADTEPWRHAARVIGDILVLSDIIDPFSYHSLPFVNQAFFVAGCCYIKGGHLTREIGVRRGDGPLTLQTSNDNSRKSCRTRAPAAGKSRKTPDRHTATSFSTIS